MRHTRRLTLLFAVCFLVSACASGTQSSSQRPRGSRTVITQAELAELPPEMNAYQAVRRLRPTWLRARGPANFDGAAAIRVFMNGVHVGTVQFLETRPLDGITEIRFYNAADATTRWGSGVAAGAIEVITTQG